MQKAKITMLGARRVGKTSLLAAMCNQFRTVMAGTELQINLEDSSELQDQFARLEGVDFESTSEVGVKPSGLGATELRVDTFTFDIGQENKPPSLQLEFADYPGEYMFAGAEPAQKQAVRELVRNCAAVVIAIDTPALMESEGRWNDKFNRPMQIKQLFQDAYRGLKEPRLVLLAPVKCEKYIHDKNSRLCKTVKDAYKGLLDLLASDDYNKNVAVVITPVQTMGTVEFNHIKMVEDEPKFFFVKTSHHATYDPKDSEQPLRYLLRFFLKIHIDKRTPHWRGLRFLLNWQLGKGAYLKDAFQKFANGCKDQNNSEDFEIIQGRQWLWRKGQ